jgi:lysophospholipase L1-like esterase
MWRHLAPALLVLAASCAAPAPDLTPPSSAFALACPAALKLSSNTGQAVVGTFAPTVSGTPTLPVATNCAPPSGSAFPVGSTTVSCTASDASHHTAQCDFVITVVSAPRLNVATVLAFGDSITAGAVSDGTILTPIDPSIAFPGQLATLLNARYPGQAVVVINDGRIGETAAAGALRLPHDLAQYHPDVVIVLEGINDLHGSVGASGIAPTVEILRTMITDARSAGVAVIIGTLLPARPGALLPGTVALIAPFNADLAPAAVAEGAIVTDLYSAFEANTAEWIGPDGLHPTEAGYHELAQLFFDALTSHFETTRHHRGR